jgi:hypothetical protein
LKTSAALALTIGTVMRTLILLLLIGGLSSAQTINLSHDLTAKGIASKMTHNQPMLASRPLLEAGHLAFAKEPRHDAHGRSRRLLLPTATQQYTRLTGHGCQSNPRFPEL